MCWCLTDPLPAGTVSGNVIVNTIAGVPAATFQSINKRLASPVAPGALTVSCPCSWHVQEHTQPRTPWKWVQKVLSQLSFIR